MNDETNWLALAVESARRAGQSLISTFGATHTIAKKGDDSNVVTEADQRAEALIVEGIRCRFPTHSIIA